MYTCTHIHVYVYAHVNVAMLVPGIQMAKYCDGSLDRQTDRQILIDT